MANFVLDENKRKVGLSITLEQSDLDFIEEIARKNRVSRSMQIRAIIKGYIAQNEEAEAEVIRANQKARDYN